MAISTDAVIEFFGTQTNVAVAAAGTVANGAFSAAADVDDWTNSDDAPMAMFVLSIGDFATGTPAAGDVIGLYCKPLNIDGSTGDHQGPNTNCLSIHLGDFLIDAVDPADTADFYVLGPVKLPNVKTSQEYEFYIYNQTSNSAVIGSTTGEWDLYVTPVTYGPHA